MPESLGCIALRPLPSALTSRKRTAEIKRLYSTPSSRGLGVGSALIQRIVAEANKMGYEEIVLDTLPRMEGARRLYERFGFRECEAYYKTPLEKTIFLKKIL
jgi:GNAT superfamily N-acetyltransferase